MGKVVNRNVSHKRIEPLGEGAYFERESRQVVASEREAGSNLTVLKKIGRQLTSRFVRRQTQEEVT